MRMSDWSSDVCSSDLDQERYASGESEQKAEKIGAAALRERRDIFIARSRLAQCASPQLGPVPISTPSGTERFTVGSAAPSITRRITSLADRKSTRLNSSH